MSTNTLLITSWIVATTSLCTALSPTFLWTNTPAIAQSKVSYEVVQGTDVVLSTVLAASGSKPGAAPYFDESTKEPEYIVAYLGRNTDASLFRQTGSTAGPLQPVLESSKSWRIFQYANYQDQDSRAIIYQRLAQAEVEVQTVGCDQNSKTMNPVEAAKFYMGIEEGPRVLLVCGEAADAATEVAEVLSLNKVLSESGHAYLVVYATEAAQIRPVERTLEEKVAGNLTCGPLCKSQVAWLQGILAAGVLLIALTAGLSCTYLLDAPSKFEAPKDAATSAS